MSSTPNRRKSPFFKTKICPWYFKNRCTRGEDCQFAHSAKELRTSPNLIKTSICRNIKRLGFCNDENCSFAHKLNELRGTDDLFKTLICVRYKKNQCNAGDNCRYAHGEEELRQKPLKEESRASLPSNTQVYDPTSLKKDFQPHSNDSSLTLDSDIPVLTLTGKNIKKNYAQALNSSTNDKSNSNFIQRINEESSQTGKIRSATPVNPHLYSNNNLQSNLSTARSIQRIISKDIEPIDLNSKRLKLIDNEISQLQELKKEVLKQEILEGHNIQKPLKNIYSSSQYPSIHHSSSEIFNHSSSSSTACAMFQSIQPLAMANKTQEFSNLPNFPSQIARDFLSQSLPRHLVEDLSSNSISPPSLDIHNQSLKNIMNSTEDFSSIVESSPLKDVNEAANSLKQLHVENFNDDFYQDPNYHRPISHMYSSSSLGSYPSFPDLSSLLEDDSNSLSFYKKYPTRSSAPSPNPSESTGILSRWASNASLPSYWANNQVSLPNEQQLITESNLLNYQNDSPLNLNQFNNSTNEQFKSLFPIPYSTDQNFNQNFSECTQVPLWFSCNQ